MDRKRVKFVVLGAGIVLSMAFLLVVGMNRSGGGFYYYLTVSEFLQQGGQLGDGHRINGHVAPGTIERMATGEDVRFTITDGTSSLPVSYHGIIPDTFVDEAEVVVRGSLQQDGTFVAHELLAKCPSKYESTLEATVR
jgi:cytochrome c-type biogenesis protein CcmE